MCAGAATDHEATTYEEAYEKLRKGLAVLVREGSASKNLEAIISGVVKNGTDTSRMAFCTDDKHLADIRREGTIRCNIEKAVRIGMDPVKAIQMATINAAHIYGLKWLGAIACGYRADIVILDDLSRFNVHSVYKDGVSVSELRDVERMTYRSELISSVNFATLDKNAFAIPPRDKYSVIGVIENQIITEKITMTHDEILKGLSEGTVRKIAVVERHKKTGFHACAYISNYGLEHGAIASTVAHDSHNIIIVGDNDRDMLLAAEELKRIHGGYTIVSDGVVADSLPLELAGLMSTLSAEEFIPRLDRIIKKAFSMKVNPGIDPFITLSFMALPVIPQVRITDCGLFDVEKFAFIE